MASVIRIQDASGFKDSNPEFSLGSNKTIGRRPARDEVREIAHELFYMTNQPAMHCTVAKNSRCLSI
jgi:hypothetical protein